MGIYTNSEKIFVPEYTNSYVDDNISSINSSLSNKADKSNSILDYNITDSINYRNITNCVIETPNKINVSLSTDGQGVITIKAGTVTYLPNGFEADGTTRKFDTYIIQEDITRTNFGTGTGYLTLMYLPSDNTMTICNLTDVYSQQDEEGVSGKYGFLLYNLGENKLYDQLYQYKTLPIAIIKITDDIITDITQVFDGFGYVGSTLYMTPGISYLCCNGRNDDSSYNNVKLSNNDILIYTVPEDSNGIYDVFYDGEELFLCSNLYIQSTFPDNPIENDMLYNELENRYYIYRNSNWESIIGCFCSRIEVFNGRINNIVSRYKNRSVDYTDLKKLIGLDTLGRKTVASLFLPSTRYIDLELQASNTLYTAPANGFFTLWKNSTTAIQFVSIENIDNKIQCNNFGSSNMLYVPVQKGNRIRIAYDSAGTTQIFRFIYAEGAK